MNPNDPAVSPPLRSVLPRSFVTTALFFFFVLAFIASPYWLIAESTAQRVLFLLVSVLLGFAWTRLAAGEARVRLPEPRAWLQLALLLLLVGALNFRALTSDIPWRGDESYHIAFALRLSRMVPTTIALAALIALLGLLWFAWRQPRLAPAASLLLVAGCVAVLLLREFPDLRSMARYPFVSRWFHALVPILLRPLVGLNHEVLYRVVPFLSAVVLAWLYARSIAPANTALSLALGLAAATIPGVFFFSSILYLEMPAVALMLAVCSCADELLSLDFDELRKHPAWYALILIGFIKETTVPFLLCFLACRSAVRFKACAGGGRWARTARDELLAALGTLLPLALYLFFRGWSGDRRQYHFEPANLIDLRAWSAILLSHLEQFGLLYLLFLGGLALLFRRKQYGKALFFLSTLLFVPLFHLIDTVNYAGYSRFNLFVLPAVLAGSAELLRLLGARRKWYLPALAVLVVASNLVLSPVNLDGTKKPYWGNYIAMNPSEQYYPVPEALAWLAQTGRRPERIRFAGFNFNFYFEFYFEKMDWHPRYELLQDFRGDEPAFVRETLQEAARAGVGGVVFRVEDRVPRLEPDDEAASLWEGKVFRNMAHALLVYARR